MLRFLKENFIRVNSFSDAFSKRSPEVGIIIIGAQKAGTSTLFDLLAQSKDLSPSLVKEIHYFDRDNYKLDRAGYHRHFRPLLISKGIRFEASPRYLYHEKTPIRLKEYNPKLKLIVSLRDPVSRALSAWNMYKSFGSNKRYAHASIEDSFPNAILKSIDAMNTGNSDAKGIIPRGVYVNQLRNYFKHFDKDQMFIFDFRELKDSTQNLIDRMCPFLGIKRYKIKPITINRGKPVAQHSYLTELENLREFYKPYNEELFSLIKERYDWE